MAVGSGRGQLRLVGDRAHQRVPKRISRLREKLDLVDELRGYEIAKVADSMSASNACKTSRSKLDPITAAALRIDFSAMVNLSMRAASADWTVAGTGTESRSPLSR